ncbi:MAG: DUF427 domain-containing protein [Dehalogenimonas sp.]|jgi:uncharacterized protein (DUF427 family)|uniref:DUF427 domain-containing protein n=1 Tax=Candidatus Dehalogenimonas loeffleri TaxID=3127115 RepID=A0ABZ2J835_9CHLR|nr:DUF427 domain-containing protein [Dehalogenimonas sp.]
MSCKATFNGKTIAESDACLGTEGNLYFPPESVNKEYLTPSERRYHCVWKGDSGYYNVVVDGKTANDGAWYYDQPSEAAKELKDYVAFDQGLGIQVEGSAEKSIIRPWTTGYR